MSDKKLTFDERCYSYALGYCELHGEQIDDFKSFVKDEIVLARAETVAEIRAKVEALQNPYPEEVFIPATKEQLNEAHEALKKYCGFPLDKISGEVGRRVHKLVKEDMIEILGSVEKGGE